MKIIDAQIHIWSQAVTPPSGLHRKVNKFTTEEALKEMDEAGVDAALIHPPYSWDPTSNQLALAAAQKYPDRFAVMGQFELDDPVHHEEGITLRKVILDFSNMHHKMNFLYSIVSRSRNLVDYCA